MPDYKSESQISAHKARAFFIPSGGELTLYLLLAIIILAVLNAGSIIQKLSNNYIGSPQNLKANFSTLSNGFNQSFSTALGGRLGQILLWSLIGALVYLGIWLAKNVLFSFENDIISDRYLHPTSYSRAGYWGSSLSLKIFLVASLIISLAYIFVSLRAFLPALAALVGSAAYNFHLASSPVYILFAVLAAALILYIGVFLMKLLSHLWKLL